MDLRKLTRSNIPYILIGIAIKAQSYVIETPAIIGMNAIFDTPLLPGATTSSEWKDQWRKSA